MYRLIVISALLSSCAGHTKKEISMPFGRTPMEVGDYLERTVPAKTLKKWNGHVSDDTVVIEFQGMEGTAK